MARSKLNRRFIWLGCLLAVAHIGFALVVSAQLGILDAVDQVLFSTPDSLGYRDLSISMWTNADGSPRVILLRPFVYPVFLGLRLMVGDSWFGFAQLALNAGSVIFVFSTVRRALESPVVAAAAAAVFATNLSFGLIAFHALAETLTVFFVSSHLFFLVRVLKPEHSLFRDKIGAALSISLAVCTKPALLPYWLFFLVVVLWRARRSIGQLPSIELGRHSTTNRLPAMIGVAAALTGPIVLQLILTQAMAGEMAFSFSSRIVFDGRFFPAVYGAATFQRFLHYSDAEAARGRAEYPTVAAKLGFIAAHPLATARVAGTTVWERNLRTSSPFVSLPRSVIKDGTTARRLTAFSGWWNRVLSWIHLGFLPLWLLAVADRSRDGSDRLLLMLVAAASYSVLLGTCMSYAQGDRLILPAMPAWLLLYPLVIATILSRMRSGTRR